MCRHIQRRGDLGRLMSRVTTEVDGARVETLAELLRPCLRAVLIGLNPSPVSVAAGHYFQGPLGLRLWERLQRAGIVRDLPPGGEDDEAFRQGIGFADVVRVPSGNADRLTPSTLRRAAPDLHERLLAAGVRPPTKLVFVFAKAFDAAAPLLREDGYDVLRMPGPYAPVAEVAKELTTIAGELDAPTSVGPSEGSSGPAVGRREVIERMHGAADELQRRYGVASLSLFGSAGRDELGPGSDVDVLVEFTGRVDFERYFGVKFLLEDLLDCPVDLVTDKMLKARLRASIAEDLIRVA